MDPTQAAWLVFLAGLVPAIVIALAGIALLGMRALAMKKRIDAYKELPVVARISAANSTIAFHRPGMLAASDVAQRGGRAVADIIDARERLLADARTVKAMWALR